MARLFPTTLRTVAAILLAAALQRRTGEPRRGQDLVTVGAGPAARRQGFR